MAKAGQRLSDAEVAEYLGYGNAGVAVPEKFAGVVMDNTDPRGIVYRYQTADEAKAGDEAAKAADSAAAEHEKVVARIRGETDRRGVVTDSAPPPMPGA